MSEWHLRETYRSAGGEVRWDVLGGASAAAGTEMSTGAGGGSEAAGRPDVVLLHGTPWSSFVWRGVARALAVHHRVFVWDMPGFGASEKREGQDVSFAAQGRVFAELLDHWGLDRPVVIAHDIGGAVALRAHLLHGAGYGRLALVDPVALAPWGSPSFRLIGEHANVFAQLPEALHRALVREYVSGASHRGLLPPVLDGLVAPWLGADGQPAFYRQIAQADQRHTDEIQDRYGSLELPVLVCWGEEDTWIPVAKAHELAGRIPGARLRLIPGAGHLVQEDAPAELTAALLVFVRDLP